MASILQDLDHSTYGFKIMEEIAALKEGKTKYMGCGTINDLITKAKKSGDIPLLGKIKVKKITAREVYVLVKYWLLIKLLGSGKVWLTNTHSDRAYQKELCQRECR